MKRKSERGFKTWKKSAKIAFSVSMSLLAVIVLLFGSTGIQLAVNASIDPIPDKPLASDKTNYDESGFSDLLFEFYETKKSGNEIDAAKLDSGFVSEKLDGTINYIDKRFDCSDFKTIALIRFYLENEDVLAEANKAEIKKCLLNFKYWMNQGGEDSMCYWSENHQILFAVSEFLVAQTFPNDIFRVDGKSARVHRENALNRINNWTQQRFLYGFNEYYSNNYYPEDMAPMSNFIQFADRSDVAVDEAVQRMIMAMDLIWFDIASQSFKQEVDGRVYYSFMSASGRMYFDNKASDDTGNRMRVFSDFVMDNQTASTVVVEDGVSKQVLEHEVNRNKFFRCFKHMVECGFYELPQVIKEIFDDNSKEQIVKSSSGLTVEELKAKGLVGQSDNQIMMQLGMEAFTNAPVIDNSIKYFNKNKMFKNMFINDFKYINLYPLTVTKTLGCISDWLNPATNGVAIERGNIYNYQTHDYSMSTSQAYQAGGFGDQQQIMLATLSNKVSVFTQSPMRNSSRSQYWEGQGRMPYSCQEKNVNLSIYTVPEKAALMEPHIVKYIHTYFPAGLFDEVNDSYLSDGYIFGRVGNSYICVKSSESMHFKPYNESDAGKIKGNVNGIIKNLTDKRYDLISEGHGTQFFMTELSSADDETFGEFVARIRANKFGYDRNPGKMNYASNGVTYESKYNSYFKVDGDAVDFNYKRYDSAYSNTEREADEIVFSYNGSKLTLNYKLCKREI